MPMHLAWHLQLLQNARSARKQPHPRDLKAPRLEAVSPQASGPTLRILPNGTLSTGTQDRTSASRCHFLGCKADGLCASKYRVSDRAE